MCTGDVVLIPRVRIPGKGPASQDEIVSARKPVISDALYFGDNKAAKSFR